MEFLCAFEHERKEYNNLLEQIIRELDELNDLERLISICKGNITEEGRASIYDVRSLFKELESKDCLEIDRLEIVKEILTQTEKTDLLKEVEEFEQLQNCRESKFERQKGISPALPRCKNLFFFGASLYSLFYVTHEFQRFLHRG